MEVKILMEGDILWEDAMEYAFDCPWKAGRHLGEKMKHHEIKGWERVFVAYEEGYLYGVLYFAKKDCLPSLKYSPYVRYLFIDERKRGNRYGKRLIDSAEKYAADLGFERIYLTSDHVGLYEKYGFHPIDSFRAPWDPSTIETVYERNLL